MILGQSAPSATTNTDVYTVPQKNIATVRILIAERGGAPATYRIAIRPLGASISNEHYVVFDRTILANDDEHSSPIELGETDIVTVFASTGNLSFTVMGVQEGEVE